MENKTEKKEWKWPLGIFLGYMIFVTSTLGFVFFTFTQKTDLVVENYYEKTLKYQDHINKAQNALDLEIPFRFELKGREMDLVFPIEILTEQINGEIVFYRPSDSALDRMLPIQVNQEGHQLISLADFQSGAWKMQVLWESAGVEYFTESNFFIR